MLYVKGFLVALQGVPVTVGVTLIAMVTGVVLGLVLALMKMSRIKVLTALASLYIEIIRGTPLIVQALIMAYGLPQLLQSSGISFRWPYLIIPAVIVCGLNSAAYVAEVIRSGIQAVDFGQTEAALSCGMTRTQAMVNIILPQAVKNILPALGNEFVTMIKETSIIQYLGVGDLMYNNGIVVTATYNPLPCYYISAIIYLTLNIVLGKGLDLFERRMKCSDR